VDDRRGPTLEARHAFARTAQISVAALSMGSVMTFTDMEVSAVAPMLDTRNRVAELVTEILEKHAVSKSVLADDDLRDVGLTSIDLVSLMLAVETAFDLTIPESEMTPQNFRSIATIEALLATLPRNRQPG
jgi:acyl carrier protein